jgi:germacradienol/geosmin synthase
MVPAFRILHGYSSQAVGCAREPGAPAASDLPNIMPGLQRWRGHSHQPFKRLGTLAMPEFVMPYPVRVNVHLDQARRHTADWFGQVGIFEPCPGISGIVWDRETFDVYDLPACVARVAPDASLPQLDLASLWYSWGTWADDFYLLFQHRRDRAGAATQSRRISLFMPLDDAPAPPPANVLERSLLDLWARTTQVLPRAGLRQLRSSTERMFRAWAWEVGNHVLHRIPDPIDYLTMRPSTLGADIMLDLLHLGLRREVPEQVVGSLAMRSLDFAAVTYCGLMNDICSYVREIEFDGELHNSVLVAEKLFRIDVDAAVLLVNDLLTARIRQFDQVVDVELPALADEYDLGASQRAALDAYVERLRGWMSGMLDWHRSSGRHEQSRVRAFRAQRQESTGGGWMSNPGRAHQYLA